MSQYFDENPDIESKPKTVQFSFAGNEYELITDRGVFSYEKIDKGTRVLLDVFNEKYDSFQPQIIVDVGCGYGVMSCVMADKFPNSKVIGVDTNKRARELAAKNAMRNIGQDRIKVCAPEEVDDTLLADLIISNPPVRIGKVAMHELIRGWTTTLNAKGQMWLVIAKNLGGDSTASYLENELGMKVTRVASKKGFRILKCVPGNVG